MGNFLKQRTLPPNQEVVVPQFYFEKTIVAHWKGYSGVEYSHEYILQEDSKRFQEVR